MFGLIFRRAPQRAAMAAMLLGIPMYGFLLWFYPEIAFLNHMAITFTALILVMAVITYWQPLPEPVRFETRTTASLQSSPAARILGAAVIAVTVVLYVVFW